MAPAYRDGARPPAAAAHPEPLSWHLLLSVLPPLPLSTPQPQDVEEERAGNPDFRPAPGPPSPCSRPFSGCQEGLLSPPAPLHRSRHAPKRGVRGGPRPVGRNLPPPALTAGLNPLQSTAEPSPPGEKPLGWGVGGEPALTLLSPL